MRTWIPQAILGLSLSLGSVPARAAGPDPAAADVLFRQGRRALLAGDLAAACAMFRESYERDPSPGALLNLGDCEERRGDLASAWQRFRQLEEVLPTTDERQPVAARRAALLARRVPYLRIVHDRLPPEAVISRDGIDVRPESLDLAVPVDPGKHTVLVRVPGHLARSIDVSLAEGESLDVRAEPGPEVHAPLPVADRASAPPPPRRRDGATLGWILGGAGVALLGVGAGVGAAALANESESRTLCDGGECTSERGVRLHSTARTEAIVADALVGTGLLATGAGAYIVLHAHSVRVGANAGGLVVGGTW